MKYFVFIAFLILTPVLSYAQFEPFQNLPGLENAGEMSTQQYIDALYVIAIVAASILVVFKLMWAGVQYMLSEVVTSKQKAKQDIQGALLGLLIILGAVTLLNTINPNLTNIDIFRNANKLQPQPTQSGERTETERSGGEPIIQTGSCPVGEAYRCGMSGTNAVCRCIKLLE